MRRIQNGRALATGILTLALALACFTALWLGAGEGRLLAAGCFALVWSVLSFHTAFTAESPAKRAERDADERDRYIAMVSGWQTLRIFNTAAVSACLACVALYGIFRRPALLTAAITLCAAQIFLRLTLLLTNRYYEKRG